MKKMYKVIKNKKVFVLENLLTKKLKADRRFYIVQRIRQFIAAAVLGIIIGLLFGCAMFYPYKTTPDALKPTIEVKAVEVTKPYCKDAIGCIRDVGESLGVDNKDITKMIRIARCESNFNQYAKNGSSTAKGIYQFIDGTWRANCLKDGNVYDFKANIECGWKVYLKQGDTPWHSSVGCWNK